MAADAVTGDIGMIEHSTGPGVGAVTVITLITTGNVVGWLALGLLAVVTGGATAEHCGMVYPDHRTKGIGTVTVLADVGGGDVTGVLALGLRTVVAAGAIA